VGAANTAFLNRHLLDLAVFLAAAVLAAFRPRAAPYSATLSIVLSSAATRALTSDGLVLAGLATGLLLRRLVLRDLRPGPCAAVPLAALAALDALVLLSALANPGAAQASAYFVTRTVLVAAVVLLGPTTPRATFDWAAAGAVAVLPLAVARTLELAGAPVQRALGDPLGIQLIGDVAQVGTWNLYAQLVAVGGLLALAAADLAAARPLRIAGLALAAVLLAAAGTAGSRTALVAALAVLAAIALVSAERRRRLLLGGLAAAVAVTSLAPGISVFSKPLLVTTAANAPPVPVAPAVQVPHPAPTPAPSPAPATDTGRPPPFSPPGSLRADWRVVLDAPYYRLDQTFTAPRPARHGNYVVFLVRASGALPDIRLHVTVNGTTVADPTAAELPPGYDWRQVAVPDAAVVGAGSVTVSFSAEGAVDSQHYFAIAGANAATPVIRASAFSRGRLVPGDLSADPGVQTGTPLAFFDGQVPALRPQRAGSSQALDESLADRLTLWRTAWHIFLRHPLLGTGFYTFGTAALSDPQSNLFTPYANAHSNFVELLSDLGALGPLLLLLLLAAAAVSALGWPPNPWPRERWWRSAVAGAVAIMLVASITQTWLADGRATMLCWVVLLTAGAAAAARGRQEPVPAERRPEASTASGTTGIASAP
jgi:hypothetical protein